MLKFKVACFAVFIFAVHGFNYLDFQEKHCFETKHYYEFYKDTVFKFPPFNFWKGFICENFDLTATDLDFMATTEFSFTNSDKLFLKNCKIEYFNEYLTSKFPKLKFMFLKNCTISFKNPSVIADTRYSNIHAIHFEQSIINDNLNSTALHKFENLNSISFAKCTLQFPTIDKYLFQNHRVLKSIHVANVNMKSFEKGLFSNGYFPNEIKCESCQLEEVDSLFYGQNFSIHERIFPSLTYIMVFKDNFIKKLPVFDNTQILENIEEIDFSQNQIKETLLTRSYFKSFKSLSILDISKNTNITGFDFLVFNDTRLWNLNVSNVNLEILNKLGCRYLVNVDLSNNSISSIPSNAFEDLFNLKVLDISRNKIKTLEYMIFNGLHKLEELRLNNNELQYINFNNLETLPKLQQLRLDNNELQYINFNNLDNLPNLHKLYLNSNNLQTVLGLGGFNLVQELYLQDNSLKTIPSLPHFIKKLDLSKNPLIRIVGDTFMNTLNLKSLDLSWTNNSYIEFDKDFLKELSILKSFKMKGNRLTSLEQIYLPSSLEELSLDNNEIEKVSKEDLQNLTNLRYLNLSNNRLTVFENKTTENLKNLGKLDISGNFIKTNL